MKLSSLKDLVLDDVQFIKELYILIFQESILKDLELSVLKSYYNMCIKIQRTILYYEYGNTIQVSHYVLNLIRNNINSIFSNLIEEENKIIKEEKENKIVKEEKEKENKIKIQTKDDIFEFLVYKFLSINIGYEIDTIEYINEIKNKNKLLVHQLKINIENLKSSITKNSILHTVELIDSLYRPDLESTCKQFTINLFYIYETESFEDLTFDFDLLESDITNYINLQFQLLLENFSNNSNNDGSSNNNKDTEILHHPIFKTTNFMEYFINLISELNDNNDSKSEVNKRKDLSKVLSSLLKLSKIVTQINNSFLTLTFQEHFSEIKKLL